MTTNFKIDSNMTWSKFKTAAEAKFGQQFVNEELKGFSKGSDPLNIRFRVTISALAQNDMYELSPSELQPIADRFVQDWTNQTSLSSKEAPKAIKANNRLSNAKREETSFHSLKQRVIVAKPAENKFEIPLDPSRQKPRSSDSHKRHANSIKRTNYKSSQVPAQSERQYYTQAERSVTYSTSSTYKAHKNNNGCSRAIYIALIVAVLAISIYAVQKNSDR